MAESTYTTAQRMEVLKEKMSIISNRLPRVERMLFDELMASQIEVMRNTLDVYWNGGLSRPVSNETDKHSEFKWKEMWTGKD